MWDTVVGVLGGWVPHVWGWWRGRKTRQPPPSASPPPPSPQFHITNYGNIAINKTETVNASENYRPGTSRLESERPLAKRLGASGQRALQGQQKEDWIMATNRNVFRRIFVVERDGGRTSTIGKETVDGKTVEETEGGKFVVVI